MIAALHNAIIQEITQQIAGFQTTGLYPKIRQAIKTPALFVDLASFEPGQDPGTGELALLARLEARVVVGQGDTAHMQVRTLAAEVARVIHKNSFGLAVKPAELLAISPDGFAPQLEAYEVWQIEWQQELHLGTSIWQEDPALQQTIYLGFAPATGQQHQDKYVAVYSN